MSIALVVTGGYGAGGLSGSVGGVVLGGYSQVEFVAANAFFTISAQYLDRVIEAEYTDRTIMAEQGE